LSFPAMLTSRLPATVDDYLNVIDYLVDLVGIDAVALGPDFMGFMPKEIEAAALQNLPPEMQALFRSMPPVTGFASIAEMPNVTRGLLARGYSETETAKIMGGNWLELYRQVWGV